MFSLFIFLPNLQYNIFVNNHTLGCAESDPVESGSDPSGLPTSCFRRFRGRPFNFGATTTLL